MGRGVPRVVPRAGGGRPRLLHIKLGRAVGLAMGVGGTDRVESLILTAHVRDVQRMQAPVLPQPHVLALLHGAACEEQGAGGSLSQGPCPLTPGGSLPPTSVGWRAIPK